MVVVAVVVVVGGAAVDFVRSCTTVIIIGIVLTFVALAYLCWLLFALAVYVLPFLAGITARLATSHSGSGPIGAIIVCAIASRITLIAGQIAFTALRLPLIRGAIALLFAASAAVAGDHAALGLAHIGIPTEGWRQAIAVRVRSSWQPRPGRAWLDHLRAALRVQLAPEDVSQYLNSIDQQGSG